MSRARYFFKRYSYFIKDQTEWKGNSFSFNLYIVESLFLLAAVMFTASPKRHHLIIYRQHWHTSPWRLLFMLQPLYDPSY